MIGNLFHSGYLSSIHKDNLTPFHTTTVANELITFTDQNNNPYPLNSLTIEANNTDLYIQILPSEFVLHIIAGNSISIDYCSIKQIKVLGNLGQDIKWYGLYF